MACAFRPLLDGFLREQVRRRSSPRIRRVRATRDRGDHDRAMVKIGLRGHWQRRRSLAPAFTALLAAPAARWQTTPSLCVKRHAILRPARARKARYDRRQIELHRVACTPDRAVVVAEQPCALAYASTRSTCSVRGRSAAGSRASGVDREEADGGAVLGRHVGDRHAVGDGQVRGPCRKTRRTCRRRPSCAASR